MTAQVPDERVIDFVDRYLAFLSDGGDEPDINELPEPLRSEALQQLRVLDEFEPQPYVVPPIEEDPIAKRFAFGRSASTITISTAALKDAVRDASLEFSDLAQKLTAAGRPTEMRELLRLTSQVTADVDRDLAARFVAILGTSVENLEAASASTGMMSLDNFLVLQEAKNIIDECARELGLRFDDVERQARDLIGAGAFRNQTENAWLDALGAALDRIRNEHSQ